MPKRPEYRYIVTALLEDGRPDTDCFSLRRMALEYKAWLQSIGATEVKITREQIG